jgi:hypothetical protein
MDIEVAVLRTGAKVPLPLVLTTTVALRTLLREAPLAVHDAVEWARSGQPQAFSAKRIEAFGLSQNGVMHDGVRDIIVASAEGDGLDLRLVNPLSGGN